MLFISSFIRHFLLKMGLCQQFCSSHNSKKLRSDNIVRIVEKKKKRRSKFCTKCSKLVHMCKSTVSIKLTPFSDTFKLTRG